MENFGWHLHCSDLCCIDSNLSSKYNCRALSISKSAFKKTTNILIIQWRNVSFNTQPVSSSVWDKKITCHLCTQSTEVSLCVNATGMDVFTQKTQHIVAEALSYPDQTFWRSYSFCFACYSHSQDSCVLLVSPVDLLVY